VKPLFRLDFKEASWEWDDATPCQYYPSLEDAKTAMRRAIEVDGQRFKNFRIYEQKAPGDWLIVDELNPEQPENSD
jgi:hypothetical protein